MPWAEVRSRLRRDWEPGQHFSIIGPTGYGKSYLATRGLLPLWSHTLILDVKSDDDTLIRSGHKPTKRYPGAWELLTSGDEEQRWRISPGGFSRAHRPIFDDAFRKVWASGKGRDEATWTLYADETRLLSDRRYLNLESHLDAVWISGRSRGITLIAGTQAPRYVPASFYEQARYLALGQLRDRRALDRLGEIGGDVDMIRAVVPDLAWHEWLFLSPEWSAISKLPGRSTRRAGGATLARERAGSVGRTRRTSPFGA